MFCSKDLSDSVKDVPSAWIFEHYLGLGETLTGQSVKIKSVFNPKDSNPSMNIFFSLKLNQYWFQDFSSGNKGSAMDLVMKLWNLDFGRAAQRVLSDYAAFKMKGGQGDREIKPAARWQFDHIRTRTWNTDDAWYWGQYKISSNMLEHYRVVPIASYNMTKNEDGDVSSFTVSAKHIYGYYSADGQLRKIYQPMNPDRKFFKVEDYLQGSDQMTYKKPYLVICASLKDAMCLRSMKMELDVVAPDSENVMISPEVIDIWKESYEAVITLFDNDAAGIKNMKAYRDKYQLPFAWLQMEKDLADAVKVHGPMKVRNTVAPIIMRQIENLRASRTEALSQV
jgi:hypothetical protein